MRIKFVNIIRRPGYINSEFEYGDVNHYIEFELSEKIKVRDDLIALTLACLCGKKFNDIFMELNISKRTKEIIEKHTGAKLKCNIDLEEYVISKSFNNQTLNFSGGFDSLGALAFLPENSSLVSIDFGKHFSREMNMINQFETHVVKTNILDTDFRKNSWLIMVIASILYKDYLNTDFNVFGSVMLSAVLSDSRFMKNQSTSLLLKGAGMQSLPYTLGLTEFGALRLAVQNYPSFIDDSLRSLASKGTEKRYRKQLYLEIDNERFNSGIKITEPVEPLNKPYFKWGSVYQADHLALYILKYKGYDVASTMVSDIPEKAISIANNMSFNFYDRYHTDNIKNIPVHQRSHFVNVLNRSGISFYNRKDMQEYDEVKKFLSEWYKTW